MPRRNRSMARASAGSTSTMCSGSSQRRITLSPALSQGRGGTALLLPWEKAGMRVGSRRGEKNQQADDHGHQSREADLPIGHLDQLAEGLPPQARRGERQDAFDHQHERESREQYVAHGAEVLPRPGDLKYLKNSDDGASTITSAFPRRLWRYASMLR